MGRQNNEQTIGHSSIALLQERFRQLQRDKEIREARKLLRFLSESERIIPTTIKRDVDVPSSKLFFHSELTSPLTPPNQQDSHFSRIESQRQFANFLAIDTPQLMGLWPTNNRSIIGSSSNSGDAEVDTSLRL